MQEKNTRVEKTLKRVNYLQYFLYVTVHNSLSLHTHLKSNNFHTIKCCITAISVIRRVKKDKFILFRMSIFLRICSR